MATRFYFNPSGRPNFINPDRIPFHSGWGAGTSIAERGLLTIYPSQLSPVTIWTARRPATGESKSGILNAFCDAMFISNPLSTQVISGYCTGKIGTRENNSADNINVILYFLSLYDYNGNKKANLINNYNFHYTSLVELSTSALSPRVKTICSNEIITPTQVTNGDYLVCEIGYFSSGIATAPTTPEVQTSWANIITADLSDVIADNSASALRGWFQISTDIMFLPNDNICYWDEDIALT